MRQLHLIFEDEVLILTEFSKYLQENEEDIVNNKSTISLLIKWVKQILENTPQNNVEKIIHTEISIAVNKVGDYLLIAKSESGRVLTNVLYNFALSYEQHVLSKWLRDKNANDFKQT